MRVLHISGPAQGGIAKHVALLCQGLDDLGVTTHLLAPVRLNPRQVSVVSRELKRGCWDLVHCHGFQGGAVGRLAGTLRGVPTIMTIHNTIQVTGTLRSCTKITEKILRKRTASWVSVSSFLHSYACRELRIPGEKIEIIANGVWFPATLPPRQKEPVVGTVARLIPSKGIDVFLKAIQLLRPEIPGLKGIVIGDGPLKGKLMTLSEELGLAGTVTFLGHRDDIQAQLLKMAVFVLPTRAEGLGISILEAMAAGVPVVATGIGGVPELVSHNRTGMLVRLNEHGAIARAVRQLLGEEGSAEVMRKEAYEFARNNYSVRKMVERTYSVYCRHVNL